MLQEVIDVKEAIIAHDMYESNSIKAKRSKKLLLKEHEKYFRPHSLELQQMERIRENYKMLLNLGFLENKVLQSNLGQILNVP